jgi:hypothetical protein
MASSRAEVIHNRLVSIAQKAGIFAAEKQMRELIGQQRYVEASKNSGMPALGNGAKQLARDPAWAMQKVYVTRSRQLSSLLLSTRANSSGRPLKYFEFAFR